MKQTAVEWLEQRLFDNLGKFTKGDIDQAKEMEKEQIIKAYETAMETDIYNEPLKIGKDYYTETFKSQNIVMFMTTENSGIESIKITDNPDCGVKGITFKSE